MPSFLSAPGSLQGHAECVEDFAKLPASDYWDRLKVIRQLSANIMMVGSSYTRAGRRPRTLERIRQNRGVDQALNASSLNDARGIYDIGSRHGRWEASACVAWKSISARLLTRGRGLASHTATRSSPLPGQDGNG